MRKKRFLETGFEDLDGLLGGGAERGTVTLIASLPGVGSTAFLGNIIEKNTSDFVCQYASWGRKDWEIWDVMQCLWTNRSFAQYDADTVKNGLGISDFDEFLSKKKINFYCYDEFSVWSILIDSIRQKTENALDFLFIDALPPTVTVFERRQLLEAVKELAQKLEIAVFIEARIKRFDYQGRSVRDTPKGFEEADNVLFLDRPDCFATAEEIGTGKVERRKAQIFVAKSKNGENGMAEFYYDPLKFRFTPWSDYELKAEAAEEIRKEKRETI